MGHPIAFCMRACRESHQRSGYEFPYWHKRAFGANALIQLPSSSRLPSRRPDR
jgi:hypothetical protein